MARKSNDILETYAAEDSVNYVLIVSQIAVSQAQTVLYKKNEGGWTPIAESAAFVGRNGIGKEREGDGKTPSGELHVTAAFGLQPNPGTSLPYIDVTPYIYACDEEGPYYNQIIDIRETGHHCGGEHMCEYSPQYDYGLVTDYNRENVYPLGSAIFLHCKGPKCSTSGCIAFDKDDMLSLMLIADKGLVIFVQ